MATTADRLALLQRTKEWQRTMLEKMYPDLDFRTIPFREYGRLFTGRAYVPGFVGGWKSYGRSNTEDAATRDVMPDYSGNGRDIKLYNFGFTGMSGWGGGFNFTTFNFNAANRNYVGVTIDKTNSYCDVIWQQKQAGENTTHNICYTTISINGWRIGVIQYVIAGERDIQIYQSNSNYTDMVLLAEVKAGKKGFFVLSQSLADEGKNIIVIRTVINLNVGESASCRFLIAYFGGLVSDGIDDYGECVSRFVLPDDYTVLAIREYPASPTLESCFVGKTSSQDKGAFIFELRNSNGRNAVYSYGKDSHMNNYLTDLFSYLSKSSYNGQTISYGTSEDTTDSILTIFNIRPTDGARFCNSVLYDLRIYDHSLTDSELEAVKNEMMSDFIERTGLLDDLNYVADWDAAGKSNEDSDRNTWTDKVNGKVINLNNYAFSEMSGWNGYAFDFINKSWYNDYPDNYTLEKVSQTKVRITSSADNTGKTANFYSISDLYKGGQQIKIKITGCISSDRGYISYKKDGKWNKLVPYGAIKELTSFVIPSDNEGLLISISFVRETANRDITIEQLPINVGLVSDGIDDYGQTNEIVTEEIGTMLCRLEDINTENSHYFLNGGSGDGHLYIWKNNGNIEAGIPASSYKAPYISITRTPIAFNNKLFIASNGVISLSSNSCFSRIILLKDQLSDIQLEALKWKVEKEYNDYLKQMGWNE